MYLSSIYTLLDSLYDSPHFEKFPKRDQKWVENIKYKVHKKDYLLSSNDHKRVNKIFYNFFEKKKAVKAIKRVKIMKFDDYQKKTHQFFVNDGIKYNVDNTNKDLLISRLALGLVGEAGEIAEKVKKYLRGDFPLEDLKKHISKEAGDQLWYLSEFLSIFDVKLSDIAQQNLDKLTDRRKRGKILGSGDDR